MNPRLPHLLLLLPLALLLFLLAIALLAASAESTLAVSASTTAPTVYGIDEYNGTVYCAVLPGSTSSNSSSTNTSSSSFAAVAANIITFAELSRGEASCAAYRPEAPRSSAGRPRPRRSGTNSATSTTI